MKAKSIKGNSPEEIKTALEQSISDDFKPTLAFVFISVKQDIEAVSNLLDQHRITIFGATTGGEFIDGDISNGGIALLLMDMNPAHFKILLHDYRGKDPEAVARTMATAPASHLTSSIKSFSLSLPPNQPAREQVLG